MFDLFKTTALVVTKSSTVKDVFAAVFDAALISLSSSKTFSKVFPLFSSAFAWSFIAFSISPILSTRVSIKVFVSFTFSGWVGFVWLSKTELLRGVGLYSGVVPQVVEGATGGGTYGGKPGSYVGLLASGDLKVCANEEPGS